MSLFDFPEYKAAVNAEDVARELAYQPRPMPICGVPIVHLNARRFMVLAGCDNHLITGGEVREIDLAFWLWAMSPDYTTDAKARDRFIRKAVQPVTKRAMGRGLLAMAIRRYMHDALIDAPPSSGVEQKHYTANVTSLVDLFGTEYGWTHEQVMEAPLAVIFQQMKWIERRKNPKAVQFNPSDRVLGECVRASVAGAN